MDKLPSAIKAILNIIFYVVYVLIFSILFSLVLGYILKLLGKTAITEPMASYIQLGVAIFVLFVTVIARKYFYISCNKK